MITEERAYVLAASLGYGRTNHIIREPRVRDDGAFSTLCGRWGNARKFPWTAGQVRRDAGHLCKACLRVERKEART